MAIVFPRPMLASFAAQQGFTIKRVDYQAPENSGLLGGVQAGFPRWVGTWTVGRVSQCVSDEIETWIDSLRGSQRTFLGRDYRRPFPLLHMSGFRRMTRIDGSAFDGSATGWSQAVDAQENVRLTLQGVPSGLVLSRIDYVGFKWDAAGSAAGTYDRRALVRVVEGGVVAADGSITVTIEPALPDWLPATAIPHLDRPECLMKLTTDTQMADVDRNLRVSGSKIVGASVLLP